MQAPDPPRFQPGLLSLKAERDGDLRTIALHGELDLSNAPIFETELRDALDDGDCHVVVDLSGLEFIDSTGIAVLVAALGRAAEDGGLRFVPSRAPAVSRVLQLTGVEERMPLVEGHPPNDPVTASEVG